MDNGVFKGMSYAEYDAIPACRQSDLQGFRRAPSVVKSKLDSRGGKDETDNDALRFGKACHVGVLQPEIYASEVAIWSGADRRTKEGKDLYARFEAESVGKVKIKPEEDAAIRAIGNAVRAVKAADALITGAVCELVLVWTDRVTGVACKARLDAYREDLGTVIDLKTTQSAQMFQFQKSVWDYGYHNQGEWYLEGLRANGLKANHFVLIAAEKEAPYLVGLYRLKDEVLKYAAAENADWLKKYQCCQQLNQWPGLDNYVVDLGLPAWVEKKM